MVTRQPSVHLTVASGMRRPSRLRLLVSKWTVSSLRKQRLAQDVYEMPPPPPPPKDVFLLPRPTPAPTDDPYAELSCEYAACSVFLSRELSVQQRVGPRTTLRSDPHTGKRPPSPVIPATSPRMLSVAELRRRRLEVANQNAADLPSISLEEARNRAQAKLEKQRLERELMEKERVRKLALEEDLRHAAQIQRERSEREQREEEERQSLIEERRAADKERRQRQAQSHKEYMEHAMLLAEEEKQRRLEARRHMIAERRTRPLPINRSSAVEADVCFEGWVTVQTGVSIAWKRRYCRVSDSKILLFKDDKPQSQALWSLPISSVWRVRERGDGLEELECLPHSFNLSARDGSSLSMFTDGEEQKELLVSIVIQLANL
ncbi:hypothetical protein PsYK624_072590 [Phanerochaete sordida]|uniref:PH domain-containing protein n=1 Tax=Phanerochaete sordida TaxID=48140 RepID=A0A9P3GC11_9APHY|nr:hypothetical protein PsYK624_072590 [Phanerochaete sordida]